MRDSMVDREERYGQIPNRITDVSTYLSIEQSLRDLERYILSFGRTLSDNERRLQQTLPGMIQTFARISAEAQANGGKLNKSQAADLKVLLGGGKEKSILYTLNQLVKFKNGKALNDRDDQSFIHYAYYLADIMEKLASSMQRTYRETNEYNRSVEAVRKNFGIAPPPTIQTQVASGNVTSASALSTQKQLTIPNAVQDILKKYTEGTLPLNKALDLSRMLNVLSTKGAPKMGYGIQGWGFPMHPAFPARPVPKMGYGLAAMGYSPAPFPPNIYSGAGNAIYPPLLNKFERLVLALSEMGDILNNIHKALGSLPIIGRITGFAAGASSSASAMKNAGDSILKKFGDKGVLGKIGKLLAFSPVGAAIGVAAFTIGAIYKQMKKSSPVLQAVSDLFSLAWNLLWMPLGNALGTVLLPMAEWLINFAIAFNKLFADFSWENLIEFYYSALQLLWGPLSSLLTSLPMLIINTLLDNAIRFFDTIGLTGVADALRDAKDFMKEIRDKVINLPTILGDAMSDLAEKIKTSIKESLNIGNVGSTLSEIGDKASRGDVIGMFDTAFRASPGGRLLEKVGVLGTGGVVTRPSLNIVGEAGPEAVIPLDKMGGLGSTYVININGDVYGVSDLESRIERVIQRTANKSYYR